MSLLAGNTAQMGVDTRQHKQTFSAQAIDHMTTLRLLELGSNKLRQIQCLDTLHKLEELWLGQNRITHMSGLDQ